MINKDGSEYLGKIKTFKKNGIKFYMTADKRYFNNCGLPIEKPNFLNEDEELKILNEEIKKEIEDKELTLEEAQNVIRRLAHPKHVNQEERLLKQAASVVLKEVQPEFEFGDEEDENVKIDTANAADATSTELTKPPGFLDQLGTTLQALGPAGMIALGSAAYFQIDTVVEETRTVATVAEEKWEEVKFEHPNINWDDPLAGFTTILGVGEIDIDLDPPELPAQPEQKESDEPTTIS